MLMQSMKHIDLYAAGYLPVDHTSIEIAWYICLRALSRLRSCYPFLRLPKAADQCKRNYMPASCIGLRRGDWGIGPVRREVGLGIMSVMTVACFSAPLPLLALGTGQLFQMYLVNPHIVSLNRFAQCAAF